MLVAGAGAVGQWLGARLQQAGHDVHLLTTQRHIEPLRSLRIEGLSTFSGNLHAVADAKQLSGDFGAIVLTSKAHMTQAIAPQVASFLDDGAPFISLQNGLGNAQKMGRFVTPERVVVAVTSHGLTLERPGLIRHTGIGATIVGPGPGGDHDEARVADKLLADAKLEPEMHADMRGFIWRKALVNHAINPVAALHGVQAENAFKKKEYAIAIEHYESAGDRNSLLTCGQAAISEGRIDEAHAAYAAALRLSGTAEQQ